MKNGIELIAKERKEQIKKHGRTIASDVLHNKQGQLREAAILLLYKPDYGNPKITMPPNGWNQQIWTKMVDKNYEDRLIIAGALIAAEIDRINELKNVAKQNLHT